MDMDKIDWSKMTRVSMDVFHLFDANELEMWEKFFCLQNCMVAMLKLLPREAAEDVMSKSVDYARVQLALLDTSR